LVAGAGISNSATPACFEGGAVESFKNDACFEFAKRQNLEVPV
jgi:hypothetical protein